MIDFSLLKTPLALITASLGMVVNGPKAMKTIARWNADHFRRKEAKTHIEMRTFKNYRENPSALNADTLRDITMVGVMFMCFFMILFVASSPSNTDVDRFATWALVVEAFAALVCGLYLLNRAVSRLNSARNPNRTLLLHEIHLMKIRLERTEARIRQAKSPILKDEVISMRSIGAKLPPWHIEDDQSPAPPTTLKRTTPSRHIRKKLRPDIAHRTPFAKSAD